MGELLLNRIYQGSCSVYQNDAMYCFLQDGAEADTLSLAESLARDGEYLFCPQPVENAEAFIQNAVEYRKRWKRKLLFLWVENPEEYWFYWKCSFLEESTRTQLLFLGRFCFVAEPWEKLTAEDRFVFSYAQNGKYGVRSNGMYAAGSTMTFTVGTSGEECGAVMGTLALSEEESRQFPEAFDIGMYYGRNMQDLEEAAQENGFVSCLKNRVLVPEGALSLDFRLSPQIPKNENRTFFNLEGNRFRTRFASVAGKEITLTALSGASLVFEEKPILAYRNQEGSLCARTTYYLGISGSFRIEEETRLLCGMTGTEYFGCAKGAGLCFVPHQSAYCGQEEAKNWGTVSWVSLSGSSTYYCQPDTAALHSSKAAAGFRLLEIPAAVYPEASPPFPMLPFREIEGTDDTLQDFDAFLYRKRRLLLTGTKHLQQAEQEDGVCAVTPQGMLVQIRQNRYDWVGFANIEETSRVPQLRWEQISEQLQQKFQDRELFLYMDSAEQFQEAAPSDGFRFAADGIVFSLLPQDWRKDRNPTLIFLKYTADRTIAQEREHCAVLDQALRNAYTDDGTVKEGYEELIEAVEEKEFRGMLIFHAAVFMDQMPKEVRFLMNGISQESFYASYLIIKAGRLIEDDAGLLMLEPSRISSLIDYASDEKLQYGKQPPDYDFLTTEIRIRMKNSKIESFYSASEILLNRLFEAKASANAPAEGNCMILEGRMEEKDGEPVFSYQLKQAVLWTLENSGIEKVWIQKVGLTVAQNMDGIFEMEGVLSCRELPEADMLGYGGDQEQEGLPFTQLYLKKRASGMEMEYGQLRPDAARLSVRRGSFPDRFGVRLHSVFVETGGETPEQKGFLPMNAPIAQQVPANRYQGILWNLPVGSLGELSSQGVLTFQIMLAFWEEEKTAAYYLGFRFPDAFLSGEMKLQGVFRLGFSSVSLEKQNDDYRIRLHQFHLEILGTSLPKGENDLFLFSDGSHIGWYAAYQEAEKWT